MQITFPRARDVLSPGARRGCALIRRPVSHRCRTVFANLIHPVGSGTISPATRHRHEQLQMGQPLLAPARDRSAPGYASDDLLPPGCAALSSPRVNAAVPGASRPRGRRRPFTGAGRKAPAPAPSGSALRALRQAAKEWVWLYDFRDGVSIEDLAEREGLEEKSIREGIDRARDSEIEALAQVADPTDLLQPLPVFPFGPFTPASACPHRGPLLGGHPARVCMVCHAVSP